MSSDSLDKPWPELPGDGIEWSVLVTEESGDELFSVDADRVLATASIGKLLLLVEVAAQLATGRLEPDEQLARTEQDTVADSGIWQNLLSDSLPVVDVAALVGAVSDNLATNVLLRRVGTTAVDERAAALGLQHTALLDKVRDERSPKHPPRLSSGNARELAKLMRIISFGDGLDSAVAQQVCTWLRFNCDLSMVAAPWNLDPLAHHQPDRGLRLLNKTGTNDEVRGDVGVLRLIGTGSERSVTYAVLANWALNGPDRRRDVLAAMAAVGRQIESHLRAEIGADVNSHRSGVTLRSSSEGTK